MRQITKAEAIAQQEKLRASAFRTIASLRLVMSQHGLERDKTMNDGLKELEAMVAACDEAIKGIESLPHDATIYGR